VYWSGNKLVLRFRKTLKTKQINYFKLYNAKKNEYKYVFDIEASMLTKAQRLRRSDLQSITIAQHKPNILRVVIKNNSIVKIRFKIKGRELIIDARTTKKRKTITKKKTSTHKKQKTTLQTKHAYVPIGKKIIVIDPGHGGKDPGAIGYRRYREKMVVLGIGKYLRSYLQKKGFKVYMTRSSDRFIKLSKRTKYANRKKADLFISIHANASSRHKNKARGIETYFLSPSRSRRAERVAAMENKADIDEMNYYGKKSFLTFMNNHKIIASNKLAIDVQQGMLLELRKYYKGVVDGGVREGPFWVLVGAQMPSVLIEVGFITNPKEARRLASKSYQKRLAKGIADGIERYFIKNR
jgi:N-acetylmuramoyl-L-alanine amidase